MVYFQLSTWFNLYQAIQGHLIKKKNHYPVIITHHKGM